MKNSIPKITSLCMLTVFSSSICAQPLDMLIESTLSDLGDKNLNKGGEYIARDLTGSQWNQLNRSFKLFELDPDEAKSLGRAIVQKAREGKVGNLENIDIDSISSLIEYQNKLKGYMAESFNYEQLQKTFPELKGYKVQYSKPSSMSTDIIVSKDGKPFKFIQTKFCNSASKSGLSCMDDALQFYADKPILLDFEGYIPKDQFDELVRAGEIDARGKIKDINKYSKIHTERVNKVISGQKHIIEGGKYERYLKFKNNPEKISMALEKIRIRPLSQGSSEIIKACEKAKSGISKAIGNVAKSAGIKTNAVVGSKNAIRFLRVGKHAIKIVEKVAIPAAVTLECGLTVYNAREIEARFERGEISGYDRDIEHGGDFGRCAGNLAAIGVGVVIFTVASPLGPVPALIIGVGGTVVASYVLEHVGEKAGEYIADKYNKHKMRELAIYTGLAEGYYSAIGIHELSSDQIEKAGLARADKAGYLRSLLKNPSIEGIKYVVIFSEGYEDKTSENFDEMDFIIDRMK